MKVTISVEGGGFSGEIEADLKPSWVENPANKIKSIVKSYGYDWQSSKVFIANYPERGRYLIKSAGFNFLCSGG